MDIPQLYEQRLCGSSFGWLFIMDSRLIILLLNPFTSKHYQLPKFPDNYYHKNPKRIIKLILSDDPSTTSDFTVVHLSYAGMVAAFWCHGDIAWTRLEATLGMIQDAIFFRGSLYAICLNDEENLIIHTIELGTNQKVKLAGPPFWPCNARLGKYLVDFLGELLFVERFAGEVGDQHSVTSYFVVHKINLEEKKYYPCADLGDYAIFSGVSSPTNLDSKQFPGCKRNSIYFTDLFNKLPSNKYDNDDIGVYDMERNTVEPCHPPEMLIFHPFSEPPIWLTPNCTKP